MKYARFKAGRHLIKVPRWKLECFGLDTVKAVIKSKYQIDEIMLLDATSRGISG